MSSGLVKSPIGNFQFGPSVGKGGFGQVYRAINITSAETVAIKQVSLQHLPKDQVQSIMSEIDLLKKLQHHNIVKYIGFFQTKSHFNIVLEYVENGSLQAIVKKFGKLPESLVVVYVSQVLEGLVYLHEQGVIHRDIKGANILTTKEGVVKLADFGVATKMADVEGAAAVAGTPYWMAPEIIELAGPSPASDIWSVGCTIVELLQGTPPYFDLAPMPALFRIVQDDHPPLPDGISPTIQDFLLQCFQKDPNLRVSAKQLLKHKWIRNYRKTVQKNQPAAVAPDEVPDIINKQASNKSNPFAHSASETKHGSAFKRPRKSGKSPRERKSPRDRRVVESSSEGDWGDDHLFDSGKPSSSSRKRLGKSSSGTSKKSGGRSKAARNLSQYAEDDEDFDDDFGDDLKQKLNKPAAPYLIHPGQLGMLNLDKQANALFGGARDGNLEQFAENDLDEGDFGGDFEEVTLSTSQVDLAAKMKKHLATAWDDGTGADDDDPFLNVLEDEDPEAAQQRELFNRQSAEILRLIGHLRPNEKEPVLLSSIDKLTQLFEEYPETARAHFTSHHGVVPLMEVLETNNKAILRAVLRLINLILEESDELQENVCMVGGIPAVMRFADSEHSKEIRLEAANFISKMCHASALTLQMFIACRGLAVLVSLLASGISKHRDLVLIAIDNIQSVFELQTRTPKNDFCRMFAKAGLLPVLGRTFRDLVKAGGKDAEALEYVDGVASILLVFSRADQVVRGHMAQNDVLVPILSCMTSSLPADTLIKLLKSVKFLSSDQYTLEALQKAGAIERLVPFMAPTGSSQEKEMHNHVLNSLFNLTRINRFRQELAATSGIVPHLQRIINSNSPLKQFALPMFCDLAHASKRTRHHLWKYNALEQYLALLKVEFWQVNSLDSIAVWLADETSQVEKVLAKPSNVEKIKTVFCSAQGVSFINILEPILKILSTSVTVNRALGSTGFVPVLLDRLRHPNALVRVNLLKILTIIYEYHQNPKKLIAQYDLYQVVRKLQESDQAILVTEMANHLIGAFNANTVI